MGTPRKAAQSLHLKGHYHPKTGVVRRRGRFIPQSYRLEVIRGRIRSERLEKGFSILRRSTHPKRSPQPGTEPCSRGGFNYLDALGGQQLA